MRLPRLLLAAAALAAAALAAPAAHAQLIPSFGATAGVNFGSLSDAADLDLSSSTGFHAGIYADLGIGPLAIRPALLYLRAGEVERGGTTESVNFVTIPVDLKLQTPTPIVKAYALAGPELRFPLGGGDVIDTKSTNVAVNAGLGVSFASPVIGPKGFAEVRYALDVSGFAESVSESVSDEYKVNLFMVRVGVGL